MTPTRLGSWARALRPAHWTKNVPVAAGLAFGGRLSDPHAVRSTFFLFASFCLVASAGYLANDVVDRREDRLHPARRARPVAAGEISPRAALGGAAVLGAAGLAGGAALLPFPAALCLAAYAATTLVYTLLARRVFALATALVVLGFLLRVQGGASAAGVVPSPWLLALTAILSLAMAVAKRASEEREAKGSVSRGLRAATDALLLLAAGGYVAWTLSPATVSLHGTRWLVATALPVVLALARFRFRLRAEREGRGPADLFARDPVLLALAALWVGSSIVVLRVAG